jgi:hypothetical protein
MKRNIKYAKNHLQKARELARRMPSPLKGITIDEAIKKIRETRKQLWEEKFASSPRHK